MHCNRGVLHVGAVAVPFRNFRHAPTDPDQLRQPDTPNATPEQFQRAAALELPSEAGSDMQGRSQPMHPTVRRFYRAENL